MSSWQNPSEDIMEMILQRLNLSDRIRLSTVCESWRSIATGKDIRTAPQFPWLVCPESYCEEFLRVSSRLEEKIHQLELPEAVRGSWLCASSRGWLVMIKEDGLNSRMYLVNPISRALQELPPLNTIPSLGKYVESEYWKRHGGLFFCFKVVLSSSDVDSERCAVAALFHDSVSRKVLGLCRPGDKTWSVFRVLDDRKEERIADILFSSSGVLYALVSRVRNSKQGNGKAVAGGRLDLGDGNAVELKLVYDKSEKPGDYNPQNAVFSKGLCYSHLVESTTQVLVVHQMQDFCDERFWEDEDEEEEEEEDDDEDADEGKGGGGGGNGNEVYDDGGADNEASDDYYDFDPGEDYVGADDADEDFLQGNDDHDECFYRFDEHPYYKFYETEVWTTEFRVYKLDPKNGNFLRVNSLEDKLLFVANNGCLSVPQKYLKGFQGNCILFATNNMANRLMSTSPDNGTFYLDNGEIQPKRERAFRWTDFQSVSSDKESGDENKLSSATVNISVRSRFSWFIPSLW